MSSNNSPNLATSINNNTTSTTTTPRTTSIDEITPKTATCTEQLLALAAASHASADMAASSTHEVDEDESSSVKQLLPVTSPIKTVNGSSTNDNSNIKEKVPTPDKAVSSNSQVMSPTTATKITEAQTPRHCNKSPYNTLTTADQPSGTKEGSTNNNNNESTAAHPNPQAAQLNTSRYFHKPIKQYWPIRYSTINTNERRIQAELGNYSTTFTKVDVVENNSKLERDRMIREERKERDARDAQREQQRNIYEQQQKYVNAHRNMYEQQQQPYGYGGSPTHYHHQALPPHHMVDPRGYDPRSYSASSQKYHYEGSGYPPHYEGYPPPHQHSAVGGYYGSPSNYQHQYNVAGYSAAQVAPHQAPSGYNVPTTSYQGSYQDEQVPLSTVPTKEDGSKDGSLHAVSSSFSNEGVGGSKVIMKSMQSPGVVTRNGSGSVGESTEEGVIPNQPSSYESNEEDDAASWHQTKDEMLRLTMTKSELTDVSKVTDESSGAAQTEKQEAEGVDDTSKKEADMSKKVDESSSAVQTPKNNTAAQQSSAEEEKKPQDVEESDLKQVPSTLSALSNSPTDEQQHQQQQPPSSTRSSRAATHAIRHYESSMNEMMMMGYHHPPRGNMMYPPPAQHHVPSPHHYGHHPYHHPHTAAYHYPPTQHYHAHPPPHMHPARLSNVHTAQGVNPEDDNSPSASTISTKASLAIVPPVMVSNTPRSEGARDKDGNTGDLMHAHQLLSLSASKSNDDDVKSTRQQQVKNSAVKTETMAEPQDDEYPPAKRRRKLSDISMNPSPTATLDNRPSPTDSATNQSQQSHQSLELGAMPSWDTAGAGRPLAGWSVCSGMGSTGGHSFGAADVHNLLGSAFSFSDSVLHSTTGGSGEHERPSSSGSSADDQDPSPKSILSKVGEKRKSLAPGTHVQFSTSSSHGGRKRGLSSSQAPPPPPMSHEEYAYYQSRHGYPPSYHSSAGHRGTYPEEDPYYGHPHRAIVSSAAAAEYVRPQFQQDRRRPESSVSSSSKPKSKIPAPQFINMHGTTMAAPGGGYWTKEEDSTLMDLMKKKSSLKDWGPMTSRLNKACGGNKIPQDVQERWVRYLKPGSRKGQWTKEEDNIVRESVESSNENPYTRWSDLSRELPGRVGKQVRDRWVNHLNPALSHEPFSKEDDLLLWEGHHNIGKRWTVISAKVFKGSRSENHIKNRWYSAAFKKFIAKEFGDDEYKLVNSGQTSADVVAVTGLVSHPKSKQQKSDQQHQHEDEHFTVIDGQTSKRKRIAYAGEIIDQ